MGAHSLISTLEGGYDAQANCPLFTPIPGELRNKIFVFALTSYDDKSLPYPNNAYYSRPGYRYHQRIDTALLATCRRIYSETHDIPVSQNEHVFWCYRGPDATNNSPKKYFTKMTHEQQDAVANVHFFTQLYWLEGTFSEVCKIPQMRPKHIKITIRHSDWWNWETNSPLAMKKEWSDNLKAIEGLEGLEIELETMERDKDQLEAIAQTMSKWRLDSPTDES